MAAATTQLAIDILGASFFTQSPSMSCVKEWRMLVFFSATNACTKCTSLILHNVIRNMIFLDWKNEQLFNKLYVHAEFVLIKLAADYRLDRLPAVAFDFDEKKKGTSSPEGDCGGHCCLTAGWQPEDYAWPVWDNQPKGGTARWKP